MDSVYTFNSVWCYSIYGFDLDKYYAPMLSNIKIARHHGIALVLHTNKKSESTVRNYFKSEINEFILIVHDNEISEIFPKLLRYLTFRSISSKFYFFKDSDSIVTQKEISIMNEWMDSKEPVALLIRDHPLHISPILAGMFGVDSNLAQYIEESVEESFIKRKPRRYNFYSYDQDWLARKVYPKIVKSADVYTSFFYYRDEKITRIKRELKNHEYIGAQVYKRFQKVPENLDLYLKLYGFDLLSLPYIHSISFLYGKVRPTLAIAYILGRFFKKISTSLSE